jgi:hypothetical protein
LVAPVDDARVNAHEVGPESLESIRAEPRPAVADVVRLLVLNLAQEELRRIAASLKRRTADGDDGLPLGQLRFAGVCSPARSPSCRAADLYVVCV